MTDEELYELLGAKTMVPRATFLENLELARTVRRVRGIVLECGTWKGGMLAALGAVTKRTCIGVDSFEGLPPAETIDGPAARAWQADVESPEYYDNCKAALGEAAEALRWAGVIQARLHQGWIPDVLSYVHQDIAILRIDVDWYTPTYECLRTLWHRISPGGLVIIDDYFAWDGCVKAVHRFLAEREATERIQTTPNYVCHLIKA